MELNGEEVPLLDCSAPFLISDLKEIGLFGYGAMGIVPLSWRDIEAWRSSIEIELPPWQSRLMIELSREYVIFSRQAEKPDCRAPWIDEPIEERRERVSQQLFAFCKALTEKKVR